MRIRPAALVIAACAACGSFGSSSETPPTGNDAGASDAGSSDAVDTPPADAPSAEDAKEAGESGCPVGVGPTMRIVKLAGGRSICVDLTEVSSAQYATFKNALVDTAVLASKVPPECGPLAPVALSPADTSATELPRVNVTFCSAAFYCAAQGKRLCGSADDGSAITYDDNGSEPPNEWELACANGLGAEFYPWGTTDPTPAAAASCVVAEGSPPPSAPRAVGAAKSCGPSGNVGPFDMIGNVWEWVNVRHDTAGGASYTGLRGGAFDGTTVGNGCRSTHGIDGPAGDYAPGAPTVGFRCCATPL